MTKARRRTSKQSSSPPHQRLVLKFPPFRALTSAMLREAVARIRFPNDRVRRREDTPAKSLSVSPRELAMLMRIDRFQATLDKLDRMEQHYRDVSKLNVVEVRSRLRKADPDDPGAPAYRRSLVNGADPRLQIAHRILALIPITRRHLMQGRQALELDEILTLNERANALLLSPHARRGLNMLKAAHEGGRRRNPSGRDERESVARRFLEAKQAKPHLTQQQFLDSQASAVSVRTLRRGLRDLRR